MTLPPDEENTIPPDQPGEFATLPGGDQATFPSNPNLNASFSNFGDYELLDEIARGGMGVVFRARQVSLNRVVALKMILGANLAGEEQIRRFKMEAESAAKLDHPGIVPIYDVGQHHGQHYFSMKLIEGRSLADLSAEIAQDEQRIITVMKKIAAAIHHAHQRGILHRDLKPANVLIDSEGEPVVTDFGLARGTETDQQLTQTGAVLGTPGFMPPEQASGGTVTTASDVYSLGAILYNLLCGQPPHQKASVLETLLSVIESEPKPPRTINPNVRPDLELICLKCLQKDPDKRYATAAELEAELTAYEEGKPLQVRPPSTFEVVRIWTRTHFGNVIWVPIIALVVGSLSGFFIWVDTVAQDNVSMDWVYDRFDRSDRPWFSHGFQSLQGFGIPLFTLLTIALGWLTAILVRTKNTSADLGAGLSVGMLTGLTAFIVTLGPMSIVANMERVRNDGFITGQQNANTQLRLIETYPELAELEPQERAALLAYKYRLDITGSSPIISIGTAVVCVGMWGLLAVFQTWIAGPLVRGGHLWAGFARYFSAAIAMGIVAFVFTLELALRATFGTTFIVSWSLTLLCLGLGALVLLLILRFRNLTLYIALVPFVLMLICFVAFLDLHIRKIPAPAIASMRERIHAAEKLLQKDPSRPAPLRQLADTNLSAGKLYLSAQRFREATEFFQASERALSKLQSLIPDDSHAAELRSTWRFNATAADRSYARALAANGDYEELVAWIAQEGSLHDWPWEERARIRLREAAVGALGQPSNNEMAHREWLQARLAELEPLAQQLSIPTTDLERLRRDVDRLQYWQVSPAEQADFGTNGQHVLNGSQGLQASWLADKPDSESQPGTYSRVTSHPGTAVNLNTLLGQHTHAVALARTRFRLQQAGNVRFRSGSDDAIRCWINGQHLYDAAYRRGFYLGNDEFLLTLPAGDHTLLLKIAQFEGDWSFGVDTVHAESNAEIEWLGPESD